MTGTILNTIAILVGGILGLTVKHSLSRETQIVIKMAMGLLVIYVGFKTTWDALHGTFWQILGQIGIASLALVLGNLVGRSLQIQARLDKIGQFVKERFAKSAEATETHFSEGFVTCTLLFCIGPMAILGPIQDGLDGNYRMLAVKAVMDGLATMVLVPTLGWGAMAAAFPVFVYQGTWSLLARQAAPFLQHQDLLNPVNAVGGLIIVCLSMIIMDLKKAPVANYLPSLFIAPLIAWIFY